MCRRIFKEQTSETGDIPFYKIGTFGADPDAFISRELFEEYKSKYPYPQKGDILISASGSIGRTVEFAGNNEYFQDSNIVWLNHDERLSNPFLKCFYSVVKWAGIEGSTIKRLYNDNILNTVICMPSVPEQKRIGLFFENLDNLITLHQRQPFLHSPPDISLIVQLTPPFYTFSWEQRKFSDITFPAGEKNKDNLPLESYSITNEHGFVPQDEKFENGGTMREADKRMYYIVSPNSFAYNPARINVGSIGYQNIGKNVIVSSLYEVFKTSEDVDDRLLWHWFKSPDFQKLIMQLQEGGVRLYFYYDKLCMGEVSLPLLEEQRKIGKLFDTLDNLITLHQRQTIVYAVIRSIRKVILAERQYFAPPMVRKFP
jgi:type I restriction enzyme S subunit